MKMPCMVILFNKEMSDKLPCGIKCAFSAHAILRLFYYNNIENLDWNTYRIEIMTSPDTIENLFEKFKKAEIDVYMQKTSHKIGVNNEGYRDWRKFFVESGTPICLAIFIWNDEHKKLLGGMELM